MVRPPGSEGASDWAQRDIQRIEMVAPARFSLILCMTPILFGTKNADVTDLLLHVIDCARK
jgi:hypothetical protein